MRNTIYVCKFQKNSLLNESFDFRDEAIDWAESHIDQEPIVEAVDLEINDDDTSTVYEKEEIFHYPIEEQVEDKENNSVNSDDIDLDALMAELEKELADQDPEGDKLHRDFPQFESVEIKEDINSEIEAVAAKWDSIQEEVKPEENEDKSKDTSKDIDTTDLDTEVSDILKDWPNKLDEDEDKSKDTSKDIDTTDLDTEVSDILKDWPNKLDEDVILFDPFGCDFSECEPMEVCPDNHRADCCKDFDINAVDFLKELAAELGIADEVEISEKECADDSCEEKHEDEIPCENCEDEISEISDEAKDPEDVVPEEVKANEEPNVEVQIEDEEPAEEISKCHEDPETGEEICEDTHASMAKPAGDKVASFNNALKYAKKDNVPYIYGYTNKAEGNKFFALEQPIKCAGDDCEKKFRDQYKTCNVVYIAYPDKDFIEESLEEDIESTKKRYLTVITDGIYIPSGEIMYVGYNKDEAIEAADAFDPETDVEYADREPVVFEYTGSDVEAFDEAAAVWKKFSETEDYNYSDPDIYFIKDDTEEIYRYSDSNELPEWRDPLYDTDEDMDDEEFAEAFRKGLEEKHCKK